MQAEPGYSTGKIRPYGDTTGDGQVQMSFTLPIPADARAREAARHLCREMGIAEPAVTYMKDLGNGYTFFIVYGSCTHEVDLARIQANDVELPEWDLATVDELVSTKLGRCIVLVGACTGSDAHTVGLDAILGAKGYHGDYGLERYRAFQVHNLGSQVPNELLVARATEVKADAILVSKVVTQKNIHLRDLTHLVDLLEAEGLRDHVTLICGGPRITHQMATELGYDAGLGAGTLPSQVAGYIASEMFRRHGITDG